MMRRILNPNDWLSRHRMLCAAAVLLSIPLMGFLEAWL